MGTHTKKQDVGPLKPLHRTVSLYEDDEAVLQRRLIELRALGYDCNVSAIIRAALHAARPHQLKASLKIGYKHPGRINGNMVPPAKKAHGFDLHSVVAWAKDERAYIYIFTCPSCGSNRLGTMHEIRYLAKPRDVRRPCKKYCFPNLSVEQLEEQGANIWLERRTQNGRRIKRQLSSQTKEATSKEP